jgi:sporulation protein YlmC with PRC-barrel domain
MLKELLTTTAVVALLSAPAAFAQSSVTTPSASSKPPVTAPGSATDMKSSEDTTTTGTTPSMTGTTTPHSSAAAAAGSQTMMRSTEMRASKLIGASVYGTDGKSVGDVNDLLVDRGSGKVANAVLSVGGFLGIGEKRVAVPLTDIKVGSDNKLTIEMTKDQLKNAPAFVYNDTEHAKQGYGSSSPTTPVPGSRPVSPQR